MLPLFKVHMPVNMGTILDPVLKSGYIAEGPLAAEFQTQLGNWLGTPNIVLVNSGTSALVLACRLTGATSGKIIISTPQTCLATNEAILTLGADIIWADIDPTTGAIDPISVENILKTHPRTKDIVGIMCVDWAGNPVNLCALRTLADQYNIKLIEDAAHSLGALYDNKKIGNHAHYVCFSFQAIKHLTTVDGGALVCESKVDCNRAIRLRWFGSQRATTRDPIKWEGDVTEYGYKFHMNDVNAAIGLEQLKTIDQIIDRHKHNGKMLIDFIDHLPRNKIQRLRMEPNSESSHWIFSLLLPSSNARQSFVDQMTTAGIATSIVHARNDTYSLFAQYSASLPGMDEFANRMINIPCGWWLDSHDMYHLCKAVECSI
jgi:perosamine synthetase